MAHSLLGDPAHAVAQAFVQFDSGCKGYLTRHELRVAHVAVLGHQPSLIELDAMLPKRSDGVPIGLVMVLTPSEAPTRRAPATACFQGPKPELSCGASAS